AGSVISTDYYRYYTTSSSTGYAGGLKYYVGGEQYARMEADLGGAASVDSASDSTISPYLTNYFEYQSDQRVTKEIAAGTGGERVRRHQGRPDGLPTRGVGLPARLGRAARDDGVRDEHDGDVGDERGRDRVPEGDRPEARGDGDGGRAGVADVHGPHGGRRH